MNENSPSTDNEFISSKVKYSKHMQKKVIEKNGQWITPEINNEKQREEKEKESSEG